jgi:hypothetical protein
MMSSITSMSPSHGFSPQQIMGTWKTKPLLAIHVALFNKGNKKSYALWNEASKSMPSIAWLHPSWPSRMLARPWHNHHTP